MQTQADAAASAATDAPAAAHDGARSGAPSGVPSDAGSVRQQAVYLDYNATAPLLPAARAAMEEMLDELGNPSSVHRFGRRARKRVEEARRQVAELAGAEAGQVVFTSGGTEANNLAIASCLRGPRSSSRLARGVWVCAAEHDSVLNAAQALVETRGAAAAGGAELRLIPCDGDGRISLAALAEALEEAEDKPALVSLQSANNETGVLQPAEEALALLRRHGVALHMDAAQHLGRLPPSEALLQADLVSISAHKFGGPLGAGALVARNPALLRPLLLGGGQEGGLRAGTENTPAVVAFGAAAEQARTSSSFAKLAPLRDKIEAGLKQAAAGAGVGLRIAGEGAPRLANTSCFALAGGVAELHLAALDLEGIALSSGSACSSGKIRPSHVLLAMGWSEEEARGALRLSMGWATSEASAARFLEAWERVCLAPLARRSQARQARSEAAAALAGAEGASGASGAAGASGS